MHTINYITCNTNALFSFDLFMVYIYIPECKQINLQIKNKSHENSFVCERVYLTFLLQHWSNS